MLDFSTAGGPTSDIVSGSSPLNMGGGILRITGAAGEANSQAFGGLNITSFAGEWKMVAQNGQGDPGVDPITTQGVTSMTVEYPKAPAPGKLTYELDGDLRALFLRL